jgi:acyl transferase domain-containing protein
MREVDEALSPFVTSQCSTCWATPALERVEVVQPALFAVMVSLAELWRSFGSSLMR